MDVVTEAKVLYNKLITKHGTEKTEKEEKHALVARILELLKGRLVDVALKHDASRVVQACLKFGHREQRNEILRETVSATVALATSKYAHFLVLKMLLYATEEQKQQIVAALLPRVTKLAQHAEASAVVEYAYVHAASKPQKQALIKSFYGAEYVLFPDQLGKSLEALVQEAPERRGRIAAALQPLVTRLVDKGLAHHTFAHRLLADLFALRGAEELADLRDALREAAPALLASREGVRVLLDCIALAAGKDRKALVKAFRGRYLEMALNEIDSIVVTRLLDTVDDTVLLQKHVLAELAQDWRALCLSPAGRKPLLHLLAPGSPRYFSREELAALRPAVVRSASGEEVAASKKDPAVRRGELLAGVLGPLLGVACENAAVLLKSPHGSAVLVEAIQCAPPGHEAHARARELLDRVAALVLLQGPAPDELALAAAPAPAPADGDADEPPAAAPAAEPEAEPWQHVMEHPTAHRVLKLLVARDGAAEQPAEFAPALLRQLLAAPGGLMRWAPTRGVWVLVALLEHPATADQTAAALRPHLAAISKMAGSGANVLGDKLSHGAKGKPTGKAATALEPKPATALKPKPASAPSGQREAASVGTKSDKSKPGKTSSARRK